MSKWVVLIASVCLFGMAGTSMAEPAGFLSAEASDPAVLGWMQGVPPAADKVIRVSDPDFFAFPRLRWTVCHFRELAPTVAVDRGSATVRPLPVALDESLGSLRFASAAGDGEISLDEAFDATYSDGLLILHHGRIVYERHAGCLEPAGLHATMSVSKSVVGLLGEILIAEGRLDETALVGDLIPELRDSGFADASVRQVLDMTTALDFSEDYADPEADIWSYAQAGAVAPPAEDEATAEGYLAYLQTIDKEGEHGSAFSYRTVNSDVLGWLLARAEGKPLDEILTERIWSRMGAEREAFYTVDSLGTPFAGGGFNATLRDLARLGQLLLDEGQIDGRQVIPRAAVLRIAAGGDPQQFDSQATGLSGWSYGSMWWHSHDGHGAYGARGVHGQTLWIDPRADMVIVRLASHPVAANAANDPVSLPAWRAVAEHLMGNDPVPLLGREWIVEEIAGRAVIDGANPSLHFGANGQLSGGTGCNRFTGRYESDGSRLRVRDQLGSTMMMCPKNLMDQERSLLRLLPTIESFRLDEAGVLTLRTTRGKTLKARR